jgi:hypothetical protein
MSVFLVSALNSLGMGATLVALSVVALDAWSRGGLLGKAYAPLVHAGAALVVRRGRGFQRGLAETRKVFTGNIESTGNMERTEKCAWPGRAVLRLSSEPSRMCKPLCFSCGEGGGGKLEYGWGPGEMRLRLKLGKRVSVGIDTCNLSCIMSSTAGGILHGGRGEEGGEGIGDAACCDRWRGAGRGVRVQGRSSACAHWLWMCRIAAGCGVCVWGGGEGCASSCGMWQAAWAGWLQPPQPPSHSTIKG